MSKKIQRVHLNNGLIVDIPAEKTYDNLSLQNDNGIFLWKKEGTVIPHNNILAIVEMEIEETKPEENK